MSDFLSKFDKDKYSDLVNEQNDKKNREKQDNKVPDEEISEPEDAQHATSEVEETKIDQGEALKQDQSATRSNFRNDAEEEVEIDLDYRRKQKKRWLLIIGGAILASILFFFIYQSVVHVEVEDFDRQPISEARDWASENDVEMELEQAYSLDYDTNQIMSQSVPAGQKIRKGDTLTLTGSLGPDPEENIPLVGLSDLTQVEAEQWIDDHKAENLQVVTEYHDEIEAGSFIKLVIRDSEISEEEYQRRDRATIYYSSGQEIFEADIEVPDFTGMLREQVESWAETNDIQVTYEEADSDDVELDHIISQSKTADEMIAQRDEMTVVVSLGKAVVVPSFWGLTAEEAVTNYPDLAVTVKERYHEEISFGTLISQSVEADTKLMHDDDKQVTVTYSLGKPYLRDFRGQLEGDLPRLFYEEYQSKGADIKYTVKSIDSSEEKGTIVKMSKFNEFVPLTYTVEISVSNNASGPVTPPEVIEEEYESLPEVDEEERELLPEDEGDTDENDETDDEDLIEK